jgi:hypothetical protein
MQVEKREESYKISQQETKYKDGMDIGNAVLLRSAIL